MGYDLSLRRCAMLNASRHQPSHSYDSRVSFVMFPDTFGTPATANGEEQVSLTSPRLYKTFTPREPAPYGLLPEIRDHALETIVKIFSEFKRLDDMSSRLPQLSTSGLPTVTETEASATASPARGREMRQNLLQKLRPPELVHSWEFWHDRPNRQPSAPESAVTRDSPEADEDYAANLRLLGSITNIKEFWEIFNNFPVPALSMKDSIHLFHKGVKPLWEDPRNAKGGAWTFRVSKDKAPEFWKYVCMLAIGDKLQECVESKRITFRDDICGVSLSVRFSSNLITIWNRDADHTTAIEKIKDLILTELPEELVPQRSTDYYYKKHSEHKGFKAAPSTPQPTTIEVPQGAPAAPAAPAAQ